MTIGEALELLRRAVPHGAARWAEFGAGRGTFTAALARLLGEGGLVVAVDSDPAAVRALRGLERMMPGVATVVAAEGDFREPERIEALEGPPLDGVLFANALHYVPDPAVVLKRIAAGLRPGGRVAVVEYDRVDPNRWVPWPLPVTRLSEVVEAAGLGPPRVVARRPSAYHREMYCAWSPVPAGGP